MIIPRRTVTALQPVFFPEAFLHRMELAVIGEPLDRGDLGTVRLHGEHGARFDGVAVDQDRAGAAQRCLAADVSTGQPCDVAQIVHQQQARLDFVLALLVIDC
jgi:hypothetical protein